MAKVQHEITLLDGNVIHVETDTVFDPESESSVVNDHEAGVTITWYGGKSKWTFVPWTSILRHDKERV